MGSILPIARAVSLACAMMRGKNPLLTTGDVRFGPQRIAKCAMALWPSMDSAALVSAEQT